MYNKIASLIVLFSACSYSYDIISHRSASGHYPEHTIEGLKYSLDKDVDYIEQDIQLTKDGVFISFHDRYLNDVTNVKEIFPNKKRKDNKYYVIDFTIEELKKLTLTNRYYNFLFLKIKQYKNREYNNFDYKITTFEEQIKEIQDYNKEYNKNIGICPELKNIWFYKSEGREDILDKFVLILKKYNYNSLEDKVIVQSFSPDVLKDLKYNIFPKYNVDFNLLQLLPSNNKKRYKVYEQNKIVEKNYDDFYEKDGIENIVTYSNSIGLEKDTILKNEQIAKNIHDLNIPFYVYTFNIESVPKKYKDYNEFVEDFYKTFKMNGIFTDYPELHEKY